MKELRTDVKSAFIVPCLSYISTYSRKKAFNMFELNATVVYLVALSASQNRVLLVSGIISPKNTLAT